jgi:dUTPase
MEFTLGSLAQKPDHSLIYRNGYQLKTVVESTIQPLSKQIIKTNIFIKHAVDYHLQLFINDIFNNKLKIDGADDFIKTTNRLFEFTITNLTNEEIFIRKNMHIVDIVAVHDVINNLTKLVPEVVTPYVNLLQLNDNNKPESDHIMEMISKEKENNNTKLSLQLAADEAERLKNIQLTEAAKQTELVKQQEEELTKQTELVKLEQELNLSKPIDIVVKSVEPVVKPKRKVTKKTV